MRQFNAGLQGLAQVKNGVSARKSRSLQNQKVEALLF